MRIWLSFDLGVAGDYEGMYAWLDDKGAKECGNSVASFMFPSDNGDPVTSLKSEIEDAVTLNKRSRVYVVYGHEGKYKGRFVVGGRKNPPWDGYGTHDDAGDDEDL